MTSVKEIKKAIISLPAEQRSALIHWLNEEEFLKWDKKIKEDSASGKLDFLLDEANAEAEQDSLRAL